MTQMTWKQKKEKIPARQRKKRRMNPSDMTTTFQLISPPVICTTTTFQLISPPVICTITSMYNTQLSNYL